MVQTAVLFPFEGKGLTAQRVTSILNSSFDAGATTFLGLWAFKNHILPDSFSGTLVITLSLYLLLAIVVFSGNSYFWNAIVSQNARTKENNCDMSSDGNFLKEDSIENQNMFSDDENCPNDAVPVGSLFSQFSDFSYILISKLLR